MLKRALLLRRRCSPCRSRAALAAPADVAAAVSAPGRPDAAVALDAGRKPAEVLAFGGLQARRPRARSVHRLAAIIAEIMARAVGPTRQRARLAAGQFPQRRNRAQALDAIKARTPNVSWFAAPADALHSARSARSISR